MSFINSDLNKQARVLEVTSSRTAKSYYSQTCVNNILSEFNNILSELSKLSEYII